MPHSLDVMHITKNVCESLLGTLLNMPERTKDGPKARADLKSMVSPAEAALVSPTLARELKAPGCTPAGTSAASGPSVNCTPAVGGASTLAELDAIITVTN